MNIQIITIFPQIFAALELGITGRAREQQIINWQCINPRDYSDEPHRNVDDRPYGGGPGMVMMAAPLVAAIKAAHHASATPGPVIYLSPQGKPMRQNMLQDLSQQTSCTLVCGRYEGIDQRVIEHYIDEEWSLGDYVLSGGEIGAMAIIDGVTRLLPGALGDEQSAQQDSFSDDLLDHPHYTRPREFQGHHVPQVLLTGDHKNIEKWRIKQALGKTWQKRPDIIARLKLSDEQKRLLKEYLNQEHEGLE